MTYYPLYTIFSWTDRLEFNKVKVISLSRLPLQSLNYRSSYCVFTWHILAIKRVYVKFHLRNYYDHSFHEHTSLGSPKETQYLNPKRYHGAFIKNTYCYWLPSTVTPIHGEYMISLQSYPLVKVIANFSTSSIFSQGWETTQCSSLVRSWLLDSLKLWLTMGSPSR